MSVWDTFFMMLMVIPISKMLSSIFMKLIARVGTIDEDKYAAMGMGTIMTVAAVAGMGKNKLGRKTGGSRGGGDSTRAASSSEADFLGREPASRVTADFLGGDDSGTGSRTGSRTGSAPIGESPLDGISERAGGFAARAGTYGAFSGAISPVAAPVVATAMNLLTRTAAGPASTGYQVASNMKGSFKSHRIGGMGRADALSRSAMDLTGASSVSEASARILGSVLGSPFGGGKTGANILGGATRFANRSSSWVRDRITR